MREAMADTVRVAIGYANHHLPIGLKVAKYGLLHDAATGMPAWIDAVRRHERAACLSGQYTNHHATSKRLVAGGNVEEIVTFSRLTCTTYCG